jgi:hypothetical protein
MKNLILLSTLALITSCGNDPQIPLGATDALVSGVNSVKSDAELYLDSINDYKKVCLTYKDSIQVIKSYTDDPNSAGGVDCNIIFKNTSKRALKYVRFDVEGINAVGDAVPCEIRGFNTDRLNVTGPIKLGQTHGYGTYWSNVWYNHSIEKMRVIGYELEYMDGTIVEVDLKMI